MNTAENLEREIKKTGGKQADEIIKTVKELAGIDVKIKDAMDEIERIDDDLVRKHNELADRINGIVESIFTETDNDESELSIDQEKEQESDLRIRIEMRIVNMTP